MELELVDLLSIVDRLCASVCCVIVKHDYSIFCINILRNEIEEVPEVSDVGLVADHVPHLRELQADSSNDCSRTSPVFLEPEINGVVLWHPNSRPLLPHVSGGFIEVNDVLALLHIIHKSSDIDLLPVNVISFAYFAEMPFVTRLEIANPVALVDQGETCPIEFVVLRIRVLLLDVLDSFLKSHVPLPEESLITANRLLLQWRKLAVHPVSIAKSRVVLDHSSTLLVLSDDPYNG